MVASRGTVKIYDPLGVFIGFYLPFNLDVSFNLDVDITWLVRLHLLLHLTGCVTVDCSGLYIIFNNP
jgi:hypothetical protein